MQTLDCNRNQLTVLNVQSLTALKGLGCGDNQLTALNVQGLTALQWLDCSGNRLTAEAFKKLFDDLPQRDAGNRGYCYLYIEEPGVTEGNHTDFTSPSEVQTAFENAKDVKHWKMYKRKMNGLGEEI
ncbi:hypothetical protein [Treponema socranskii]|uniref:hypothetical protein n=1 Tax=Treponema socranskii TaxID=53419 RepID=UPI003D916829